MIHQLLYRSRANVEVSPVILACIGDIAEIRNARLGITGLLRHRDGMFEQLLEGPKGVVETMMARISGDSRHRDIEILQRRELPEREFGDWAMAIVCEHDAECGELAERCGAAPSGEPCLPRENRTR
ncbi:BLUF domain-containing protein [Novosphingopyxis sp.]|uniref:BLUF domain-containing protein n=1 Tax=Novosphingopyxis sp. TaxID=2709690 RepID=UPI003B5CD874